MKIDHIIVYRDPRPRRVSVPVTTGHASSVTAAGTVPRMRPRTTTLCMLRLGVFRTRQHERTKNRTLENLHATKNGGRYTYVDESDHLRHVGDDQIRRRDQVGPEDEWRVDGGK